MVNAVHLRQNQVAGTGRDIAAEHGGNGPDVDTPRSASLLGAGQTIVFKPFGAHSGSGYRLCVNRRQVMGTGHHGRLPTHF